MEKIVDNLTDKISSYNIFNNLLPGIVFCFILKNTTRFSISNGDFFENLFVYYFVGMVTSRIGSLIVEKILSSVKIKKHDKSKESFITIPDYDKYIFASENQPFIKTLRETNNICRTMVSVTLLLIIVKIYDMFLHDKLLGLINKEWLILLSFIILMIIFIASYKKQSAYVYERVEVYMSSYSK